MFHTSTPPLLRDWAPSKSECIDWGDAEDVVAHHFPFMLVLEANPALARAVGVRLGGSDAEAPAQQQLSFAEERRQWCSDPRACLARWGAAGLLNLSRRGDGTLWCAGCGRAGHTVSRCPDATAFGHKEIPTGALPEFALFTGAPRTASAYDNTRSATQAPCAADGSATGPLASLALRRFREHCRAAEVNARGVGTSAGAAKVAAAVAPPIAKAAEATGPAPRRDAPREPMKLFEVGGSVAADSKQVTGRRVEPGATGTIRAISWKEERGELETAGGPMGFYLSRAEFGFHCVEKGAEVSFSIERNNDFARAIDVRLARKTYEDKDIDFFLDQCRDATRSTVVTLRRIVSEQDEWDAFVAVVRDSPKREQVALAVMELACYRVNQLPIHEPVMRLVVGLFSEGTPKIRAAGAARVARFVTDVVVPSLPKLVPPPVVDVDGQAGTSGEVAAAASTELGQATAPGFGEHCALSARFLLFLRRYGAAPEPTVTAALTATVDRALAVTVDAPRTLKLRKLLQEAARLLRVVALGSEAGAAPLVTVLPTAEEIRNYKEVFASENLPVLGERAKSQEELMQWHCKLLRADCCYATARLISHAFFNLPGLQEHDAREVQQLLEDSRTYSNVRFVGQTCSRHWDPTEAAIVAFEVDREKPTYLSRGQLIFIYTGADNTQVDEAECFWFTVATAEDSQMLQRNMVALVPLDAAYFGDEGNERGRRTPAREIARLREALQRNERMGMSKVFSRMLEGAVFVQGYAPVFRALTAFLLPGADFTLPVAKEVVEEVVDAPDTVPQAIPPHYLGAFSGIVDTIRSGLVLDAGQDGTLQSLMRRRMLLVQGPPGTGKSFIGCRVVESYVRFKEAMRRGHLLSQVDPLLLPSCTSAELAPRFGPIVVITYKNHALDEFLLDLRRCGLWGTASDGTRDAYSRNAIVRVGGGSTDPEIEEINLNRLVDATPCNEATAAHGRMMGALKDLEKCAAAIRALEDGAVTAPLFERWLTQEQRDRFYAEDLTAGAAAGLAPQNAARSLVRDRQTFPQRLRAWLQGAQYHGPNRGVDRPFDTQVRSALRGAEFARNARTEVRDAEEKEAKVDAATAVREAEPPAQEGGIELSTFAAMRAEVERESKQRSSFSPSDAGAATAISAEALEIALAASHNAGQLPEPESESATITQVQTVWSLHPQARHDWLVRRVRREMAVLGVQYLDLARQFDVAARLHRHIKEQVKAEILGSADVIGLTTTGCAMNQNLLRSINPRILVVEEAAEVLESQLLACIPESIRQVVLIGDHYQLQPKVETFAYQKQNKLALSLFERLVGRTPPIMLTEQRRMKPGIAALVRPFYRIEGQSIEDHPSVVTRPFIDCAGRLHRGVPGLVHDVFMWAHKHHEEVAHVGRSKINQLEVRLSVLLVRHLLRHKVPPRSIAVITPYTGQRGAIRGALKEDGLNLDTADSVRVSTVDRFQGDESDIIILSLVRTNQLTDFLKTRNRMVVAVSRARHAMIMLGNPELLNQSPHWKELLDIAAARGCVGESMPIRIASQGGESATVEVPSSVTAVTWPKP